MRRWAIAATMASVWAASAWAQPADAPPPGPTPFEVPLSPGIYDRLPGGEAFARLYPEVALQRMVYGRVSLACTVTTQNLLEQCKVEDEKPAGWGFGQATLALAPEFSLRPAPSGQSYAGGTFRFPVRWNPGDALNTPLEPRMALPSGRARGTMQLWAAVPSAEARAGAHPGTAGFANLQCEVVAQGALSRCITLSEVPRDRGIGAAALALTEHYKTQTRFPNGVRAEGAVLVFSVSFGLPPASTGSTTK